MVLLDVPERRLVYPVEQDERAFDGACLLKRGPFGWIDESGDDGPFEQAGGAGGFSEGVQVSVILPLGACEGHKDAERISRLSDKK